MRISGNSAGPEDGMADKKKGTIEGGSASGTKAPDKGAGKNCGSGSRGQIRAPDRTQHEVHEDTEISQEKQISPAEAREES